MKRAERGPASGSGRMRANLFKAIPLILLLALTLSACGGSGKDSASSSASSTATQYSDSNDSYLYERGENIASYGDMEALQDGETTETSESRESVEAKSNRKLITTANIEAEAEDYDGFMSWLEKALGENGGYVENSDLYSYIGDERNCQMKLRVPAGKLDGFLKEMEDNCNILQRSTQEDDVTLSYVDTESHRNALLTEQERLLELLSRAENLEDIITLEDRLTQVRYELQNYESALRVYDDQIDYSTVNLSLREVRKLTEPDIEPDTWGSRAWEGMKDNARSIGVFFQELGLFIVVHLPTFLLLAAVALVVLICTAKKRREARERRQAQKELLESMKNQSAQNKQD